MKKSLDPKLKSISYFMIAMVLVFQVSSGFGQAGSYYGCLFDLGCDFTEVSSPSPPSEIIVINNPVATIRLGYCSTEEEIIAAFQGWFDNLIDPSTNCSQVHVAEISNLPIPLDDVYGPLIDVQQLDVNIYGGNRFLYDIGYDVNPHLSTPGQIFLPGTCGGAYTYELTILGLCEHGNGDMINDEKEVALTLIVEPLIAPRGPESVVVSSCTVDSADIVAQYESWVNSFENTLIVSIFTQPFFGNCSPAFTYRGTRNLGGPFDMPIFNGPCGFGEEAIDCMQRKLRNALVGAMVTNGGVINVWVSNDGLNPQCPGVVLQSSFEVTGPRQIVADNVEDYTGRLCNPEVIIDALFNAFINAFGYDSDLSCGLTVIEEFQKMKPPENTDVDRWEPFDPATIDISELYCGGQITVRYAAYDEMNRNNRDVEIASFTIPGALSLVSAQEDICSGQNVTTELAANGAYNTFFNPIIYFKVIDIVAPDLIAGDNNIEVGDDLLLSDALQDDVWLNLSGTSKSAVYTVQPLIDCVPADLNDGICEGQQGTIVINVSPINCPMDLNLSSDPGQCGATQSLSQNTGCSEVEFSYLPAVPGLWPVGSTSVDAYLEGFSNPVCSFSVTVADIESPVISCPANITVVLDSECNVDTSAANTGTATITDNCDGAFLSRQDVITNLCGASYDISRTWTGTDASGNQSSCVQLIQVRDMAAPTIICPPDVELLLDENCLADVSPSVVGSAGASDNCDSEPILIFSDTRTNSCAGSYGINRTWTATDACGNSSSCLQTITVRDTTPPTIVCPSATEIYHDGNCMADDSPASNSMATASDNCSSDQDIVITSSDEVIDDCAGSLVIMRTWMATDACGNSSSCIQTITVSDTTRPVIITCAPSADLGCNPVVPDALVSDISASDNCSVPTVLVEQGVVTSQGALYARNDIYVVTDDCGNSISCSRTLTWKVDLIRPVLSGAPEDLSIACEGELPVIPLVTAMDNVDGSIPVSFRQVSRPADCGGVFYNRIWTAIDACGNATIHNQTIELLDDVAPTIAIPADTTINFGEMVPLPQAVISDNCSQIDKDFFEVRTDHNPGEYTLVRTWTAIDGCSNAARRSQKIEVVDDIAPVITLIDPMLADIPNGGSMDIFDCEAPAVSMANIEVSDANPEVAVETYDELVASNACSIFGYYRKWKCGYIATDGAGNVAEYAFYVHQYDTLGPELLGVPPSVDLHCDEGSSLPIPEVFAADACQGTIPVDFNEEQLLNPADTSQQALIRTWSAADACGNLTQASQTITFCGFDMNLAASGVGNTVWFDANANGLQDSTESGMDGIRVNLYWIDSSQSLSLVFSTMTKSNMGKQGQFSFDHLFPGTYQIEIELPDYLGLTQLWQGSDTEMDSDIDPLTMMTNFIRVDTHEMIMNIDAGVILVEEQPMVLSKLEGQSDQCINTLTWTTVFEQGVEEYEIQRAGRDAIFETIGYVNPQANYFRKLSYQYKDLQARGSNIYRLKVLYADGKQEYSDELVLETDCRRKIAPGVGIFPNPFVNIVNIGFDLDRGGEANLRVVDYLGRDVMNISKTLPKGKQQEQIDLEDQPAGIYWLQLRIEDELIIRKVVKSQ